MKSEGSANRTWICTLVEEVLRSFTSVKVVIPPCGNTITSNILHSKEYLIKVKKLKHPHFLKVQKQIILENIKYTFRILYLLMHPSGRDFVVATGRVAAYFLPYIMPGTL